MYKNKTGWYKVVNIEKLILPIDEHMKSHKDGSLQFKSSLELIGIKFCDSNPMIIKFALEPFAIKYISPKDGKSHRYYIDLFIEFKNGEKFLVEIKSKSETLPPNKPKRITEKSSLNYQRALLTYAVNQAKWKSAKEFSANNNMKFIILTENELKG